MIKVVIKPRNGDGLYEIHVGDAGDNFLVSHQGYENAADAEKIARRLFGRPATASECLDFIFGDAANLSPDTQKALTAVKDFLGDAPGARPEPVDLTVQFRDGKGRHEMLR